MKIGKVRLEFKVSSLIFLIFVYMAGWGLMDQGELDLTAHFFLTTVFAAGIFLLVLASVGPRGFRLKSLWPFLRFP